MHERGCPTEGFEQRLKDLSVGHGRTFEHYRAAHDIETLSVRSKATTEQSRGAKAHCRALSDELLSNGGQARHARTSRPRAP